MSTANNAHSAVNLNTVHTVQTTKQTNTNQLSKLTTTPKKLQNRKKKEEVPESDDEIFINNESDYDTESETDSNNYSDHDEIDDNTMDVDNRPKIAGMRLSNNISIKKTPFAFKLANYDIKNENELRLLKSKDKFLTQFNLEVTNDGTVLNLEKMLNLLHSEFLVQDELDTIKKFVDRLNQKEQLQQNDITKAVLIQDKLNKIIDEQQELILNAEIYLSENLYAEKTETARTQIESYKASKTMTKDQMSDLSNANKICKDKQLLMLRKNTLTEIIANTHLHADDIEAAKVLLSKLTNEEKFNDDETKAANELLKKQLSTGKLIHIKTVIDEALKIKNLSKNNKIELDIINNKYLKNEEIDISLINKVQYWINKSKLDPAQTEYFNKMNCILEANRIYEEKFPTGKYTITLKGKGINAFQNSFEARVKEIKRCSNLKSIIRAELLRDTKPEESMLSKEELLNKVLIILF